MRVALVHDYLNQLGGAERVFQEIAALFPRAPIYTIFGEPRLYERLLPGRRIITSLLERWPWLVRHHYYALWFMPYVIERFDFSRFDLVVSSSSSFAKGIVTGPRTLHISYVATPLRYVWDDYHQDSQEFPLSRLVRPFVSPSTHYLRVWDFAAAKRPDTLVTNSEYSRLRIQRYYGRDATVIYPPVDTQKFKIQNSEFRIEHPCEKYFLMVGRLTPYKRFDLAVETFSELGLPLWIVGDGPQRRELERRARANIRFLGWVSEPDLPRLYAGAEALVFPQLEHFGLVAPEAMAAGTPVIAFRGGGALEIVKEGVSGVFFDRQTPASLAEAVRNFRRSDFDPAIIQREALRFDRAVFREKFMAYVEGLVKS